MMGVAFEIQIHWPRPTLESARLKDSMDVGDANEFQKGDENSGWPNAQPMFDSKRRTRALMTKSQMSELKRLWRDVSHSQVSKMIS